MLDPGSFTVSAAGGTTLNRPLVHEIGLELAA